jgi:hypothetical protein
MKPRWLKPEEISDQLQLEVAEVHALIEQRELRAVELPSGVRRVDPRSFRWLLRGREVGALPRFAGDAA